MTAASIADLERKAKAATPGPWSADSYGSGQQVTGATGTVFADTLAFHEDAEFIAAANPAAILRLIGELRRWKAAWEMASPLLTECDALAARMPCDGGCNYGDGPVEDCSRHGRPPAEVWQIVTEVQAQRDVLAARLAAIEALVSEWERVQEQNRTALGELARGTTHLLLDTPGPADFRAALSAAPTDTTKEN